MCVTVEPGIYLPGRGGVRIEDSGVVRAAIRDRVRPGYEVLTLTSKDWSRSAVACSTAVRPRPEPLRPPFLRKGRHRSTMASTSDFKNGLVLNLDGQLWTITEFQHVKPGKGPAFVRTTLKNVMSGKVVDKTFNAGIKVDTATVDKRDMTFLYKDGVGLRLHGRRHLRPDHRLRRRSSATVADYLLENQEAMVAQHDGVVLFVELPASVELVVSHTDPGLQGDRSTGGTKPATLETGAEINVPLFLNTGDKIKVDTRDGRYLGRVNS